MRLLMEWNPGNAVLEAHEFVERYGSSFGGKTFEASRPFPDGASSQVRRLAITWVRTEVDTVEAAATLARWVSTVLFGTLRAIRCTLDGKPFDPDA